jgi:hypothetical protein
MRNRLQWITLVLVLVVTTCGAQAGTNTAYSFLRNDVSARAAGMAGSFVAATQDPSSLFFNAAGLGTVQQPSGSVGFFKHIMDINAGYVAYAQPFEDLGYFGAGVVYMNYGSFDETDDLGNVLGTFNASDLAVSLGYSNTFQENLYYGAGVKFIYSTIAGYSSTALAADLGLLYLVPESDVVVGLSVRNLGTQLDSYISTKEDLPLDVVVGGSVIPRGLPLRLHLNFHKLNDDAGDFIRRFKAFSVGGEFTLSTVLQLRFGYDNEQRKELKIGTSSGLAGFSGGLGISVSGYKLNYALSSLGKVGNWHRVSLGTTF